MESSEGTGEVIPTNRNHVQYLKQFYQLFEFSRLMQCITLISQEYNSFKMCRRRSLNNKSNK